MKKRGFTLIELLAVIVILAIIALIATPIILGVIDKARIGAAKSSALGYIDAIEKQVLLNTVNYNKEDLKDGNYDVTEIASKGLSIKGNAPLAGHVDIAGGIVSNATLCINGYLVKYSENKVTTNGKCNEESIDNIASIIITNTKSTTNSFEIEFVADDKFGIKDTKCYYSLDTKYNNKGIVSNNKCIAQNLNNNETYNYKIAVTNKMGTITEKPGTVETKDFETISIVSEPTSWASSKTVTISGNDQNSTLQYQVGLTVDEENWTNYTAPFTINSNTNIYARLYDGVNTSSTKTYSETKIDTTEPVITVGNITGSTNKLIIPFTALDEESNIKNITCEYGTSNTYGSNGIINSDKTTCTLNNLTSGSTYYYKITSTNNAGLTQTVTGNSVVGIADITFGLNPSGNSLATSVEVTPTFATTNVTTKTYYIKSTIPTTVNENVYECGNAVEPGTCSSTATNNLNSNYWYKTTSNKPVVTFTENGSLFALINDGDNYLTAKSINIANIAMYANEIYYNNSIYTNGEDKTVQEVLEELYGYTI